MGTYVIAYDLHKKGQNYDGVIKKIKSYGTWCHLQGSVWLVKTNSSAVNIRDNISSCLDANDKLMVAKLSGEAAWTGYSQQRSNWVKENA